MLNNIDKNKNKKNKKWNNFMRGHLNLLKFELLSLIKGEKKSRLLF